MLWVFWHHWDAWQLAIENVWHTLITMMIRLRFLDTLHEGFLIHALYYYLVENWGVPDGLGCAVWYARLSWIYVADCSSMCSTTITVRLGAYRYGSLATSAIVVFHSLFMQRTGLRIYQCLSYLSFLLNVWISYWTLRRPCSKAVATFTTQWYAYPFTHFLPKLSSSNVKFLIRFTQLLDAEVIHMYARYNSAHALIMDNLSFAKNFFFIVSGGNRILCGAIVSLIVTWLRLHPSYRLTQSQSGAVLVVKLR